ncbi:GAF domain-containing protein, partial [Halolamina salina]|uniref:GAF domain-containing protein n=1 Tax=Halolamina salina TaxID=1220023 RepID=UPI003617F099
PGGIGAAYLDFLGTVAGNVEAALDRVEREREREEHERLLEKQNRTLERLDRINGIIRGISRSLVRASTREEIESVVCRQLADDGPYGLAWIGDREHAAEGVTVRAGAGAFDPAEGIDGVLAAPGSTADRAAEHRELRVVNDVLDRGEFDDWQRAALDRGYHAVASIPLVYEDAMYGVLSVYADRTGVFGDLERAVLSELGDMIAYAINAAESKRALVGRTVTRIEFDVSDTEMPFVELARELGCSLVVENFVYRSDGGVRRFLSIRGATAEAVSAAAEGLPFEEFALVSEYEADGEPVGLRVSGVSGSVDAASESYLGDPAGSLTQEEVAFAGAEHPARSRDGAVDMAAPAGWIGATVRDLE